MHILLPMVVSLIGAVASPDVPPASVHTPPPAAQETPKFSRVFKLPLRIPKAQIFQLLQGELKERRLLKDFQVVTSKFSNGRVLLDRLEIHPGPLAGTVRLEAHGRLRFDRKQLGVRWRGLKSHKKWFRKGDKDAAKVRVTCVAKLGPMGDGALGASLTGIRVKLESRLHPARGLTARFDMDPRTFEWTPEGGLFDHIELSSLKIAGVDRKALRLEVAVSKLVH